MIYIFDIDGTIADCRHRVHHIKGIDNPDWEAFDRDGHKDKPIWEVIYCLWALSKRYSIVLCTGRSERGRKYTEEWLEKWKIPYNALLMRPEGDHRPDTIVKKEVLDAWRAENAIAFRDIVAIFEDRKRVVDMWRTAGYRVFQVDPGEY
jgi:hypothetical protein